MRQVAGLLLILVGVVVIWLVLTGKFSLSSQSTTQASYSSSQQSSNMSTIEV